MNPILAKATGWIGVLWIGVGATLTALPGPKLTHPRHARHVTASGDAPGVHCNDAGIRCFGMDDGTLIAARTTPSDSDVIIVLLHGVLSDSSELKKSAEMLHESTNAQVIRLDLRGHGLSSGRPGDVGHIGQYEDDVASVIETLRHERPDAKIILAGHSMGGGIVTRYAMRHKKPSVDGYLLLAPHLGDLSPSHPRPPAKNTPPDQQIIKMNVKRAIGLAMLNTVGIHWFDRLDTFYVDLPFELPIPAYSYRALASMSPRNYRQAMKADAKPLFLVAGTNDEFFTASGYPAAIKDHQNGKVLLVPGETHDGITRSAEAMVAVKEWMESNFAQVTKSQAVEGR